MMRRAKTVKPKPKKKLPSKYTLEWLDNLDVLYEDNQSWI